MIQLFCIADYTILLLVEMRLYGIYMMFPCILLINHKVDWWSLTFPLKSLEAEKRTLKSFSVATEVQPTSGNFTDLYPKHRCMDYKHKN